MMLVYINLPAARATIDSEMSRNPNFEFSPLPIESSLRSGSHALKAPAGSSKEEMQRRR